MDLMDSSAVSLPSELEEMEEEARLIHESEWELEVMRPLHLPLQSSSISFGCSRHNQLQADKAVSDDPVDLIQLVPPKSSGKISIGSQSENVVAERNRREKLNQGFIHLSSLLPGLKKLDKASVLAEAASYVKQLQAQVKKLEEQTILKREKESVAQVFSTEDRYKSSSILLSDDKFCINNPSCDPIVEVEARISDKDVLIKVHSMRKHKIVARVLEEIQRLNLDMINYNAMDFGLNTMVITVLAKMNEEFLTTAKNMVEMLQQRLQAP